MPGMTPDEVLAVCRLRQWAADRTALRDAKTTDYQRTGWRERRTRQVDARLVRVIDFERALTRLTQEQQTILLLTYREHRDRAEVSTLAGISPRSLTDKLPAARQALARTLDLLNLL